MSAITAADANTAPPPGLILAYEILSPAEEQALVAQIQAMNIPRVAIDPMNPRSSKAYGWDYLPDDTILACPDLPPAFDTLRDRVAAAAGVTPDDIVQGMLIRYDPGAIIQWHRDKAVWDRVIGVSLGDEVVMGFRNADDHDDVRAITLPPRSVYVMTEEARYTYEHGLPPATGTRWSITYRCFSPEGEKQREIAQAKQAGANPAGA